MSQSGSQAATSYVDSSALVKRYLVVCGIPVTLDIFPAQGAGPLRALTQLGQHGLQKRPIFDVLQPLEQGSPGVHAHLNGRRPTVGLHHILN